MREQKIQANIVPELRSFTYWCGSSNNASRDIHPLICDLAANAIEYLLAENARLRAERDAAVNDINAMGNIMYFNQCEYCAKDRDICDAFDGICEFEWHGTQEGNG